MHLGCFIDDPHDAHYIPFLEKQCGESCFFPLNRRWATVKSSLALLSGDALSNRFYASVKMREWVNTVLQAHDISTIFVFSSTMAQFALTNTRGPRVIMDFVDVDSEKWRQYAAGKRWPMKWVYAREAEKLAALERRIAERVDASLFVSQAEADVFRKANPGVTSVHAVSNGVDVYAYDPDKVEPKDLGAGPHVVFTGAMDYWANADAICWFVKTTWPLVRKAYPAAQLHIVGAHPLAEVEALHGASGVLVTGRVDDVKPYIRAADVAIAPMRIARGIQNKVLEAMALARPVVATSSGAEGIDVLPGEHLETADTAADFAEKVIEFVSDKAKADALGRAARVKLCEKYSWDAKLADLDAIVTPTGAQKLAWG